MTQLLPSPKPKSLIPGIHWFAPMPLGLSRGDVSAIAAKVANNVGLWPGEALDALLRTLGGRIEGVSDQLCDEPSLVVRPSGFTIKLCRDTTPLRDRLDIAQDIGHYVLHVLYQNQHRGAGITHLRAMRYGYDGTDKQAKTEAIWFAAGLLMPNAVFRKAFEDLAGNEILLSDRFKVSTNQVKARAQSLGLLPTPAPAPTLA